MPRKNGWYDLSEEKKWKDGKRSVYADELDAAWWGGD